MYIKYLCAFCDVCRLIVVITYFFTCVLLQMPVFEYTLQRFAGKVFYTTNCIKILKIKLCHPPSKSTNLQCRQKTIDLCEIICYTYTMQYETFKINGNEEIKLCISKEHRFGTDSLLLGEFAGNVRGKIVADLCSGCGIIPIMLCGQQARRIYAVEIAKEAADLLRRTVALNQLNNLEVIEQDLRNMQLLPKHGEVDIVTANPPYYLVGCGRERESAAQRIARHENECTLSDVVKTASVLLKYGGYLKMCMTAARLAETIATMQLHKIEPKEIVFVGNFKGSNNDTKARLFLISGKKGGKSGVNISWKNMK